MNNSFLRSVTSFHSVIQISFAWSAKSLIVVHPLQARGLIHKFIAVQYYNVLNFTHYLFKFQNRLLLLESLSHSSNDISRDENHFLSKAIYVLKQRY